MLSEEQRKAKEVVQSLFKAKPLTETVSAKPETYLLLQNDWLKVFIHGDGEMNVQTEKRDLLFELGDYSSHSEMLEEVLETIEDLKVESGKK